jgi:hypothetical protein
MVSVLQIGATATPTRGNAEAWPETWPSALSAAEQAKKPSHAKPTPDSRQIVRTDTPMDTHLDTHLDTQRSRPTSNRPAAPFLAQLIAVKEHVPQMSARKRTDPRSGAEAYADMVRLVSHRHDDDSVLAAHLTVNA